MSNFWEKPEPSCCECGGSGVVSQEFYGAGSVVDVVAGPCGNCNGSGRPGRAEFYRKYGFDYMTEGGGDGIRTEDQC